MLWHAALTVIPLWIAVYIGMHRVYKVYKLRETKMKVEGMKNVKFNDNMDRFCPLHVFPSRCCFLCHPKRKQQAGESLLKTSVAWPILVMTYIASLMSTWVFFAGPSMSSGWFGLLDLRNELYCPFSNHCPLYHE